MSNTRTRREEFSPIWQIILSDGSVWTPSDSSNGPCASYIYARSTANMFAEQTGGTVRQVMNADGSPKNGAR